MGFPASNNYVFFLKKKGPCGKMQTRQKDVSRMFFWFFPGEIFLCITNCHTWHLYFSFGKTAIFRTQFSSHTTIEFSHTTVESSHTTVESSRTTVSHTTIESCWSTIESCWSTIESCGSTSQQKYEENGRILHNLAFVWSKSIKIEHGPAISIDCLDLSLK